MRIGLSNNRMKFFWNHTSTYMNLRDDRAGYNRGVCIDHASFNTFDTVEMKLYEINT